MNKKILVVVLLSFAINSKAQVYELNSLPFLSGITEVAQIASDKTIKEHYELKQKKVFYIDATFWSLPKIGGSILIDLVDYYSYIHPENAITTEGKNGWITIWLAGNIGLLSVGTPVGAGVTEIPMKYLNTDPKRTLDFTALSIDAPFLKFEYVKLSSIEKTKLAELKLNPTYSNDLSLFNLGINLTSFEIKAEKLDEILSSLIGTIGLLWGPEEFSNLGNGLANSICTIQKNSKELTVLDFLFGEGNARAFTTFEDDDLNHNEYDGLIKFYNGGEDIDGDGFKDNYYPVVPKKFDTINWEYTSIGGTQVDMSIRNIGYQETDYRISTKLVEGVNWIVKNPASEYIDNDLFFYDIFNLPPASLSLYESSANAEFLVSPLDNASNVATIRFYLSKRQLFTNGEVLDSVDVQVYKLLEEGNNVPSLKFIYPQSNLNLSTDDELEIVWSDVDIEDNAYLSIALDPDFLLDKPWEGDNNHRWLEVLTREDPDGTEYDRLNYNLSDMESGQYCVWGVIFDGYNEPIYLKSPSVITIIKETKLVNGSVSPANAPLTDAFSFAVTYLPANNLPPTNPIELFIDNTSYEMFENGDNWSEEVKYTYANIGSTWGEGTHEFHFQTEVDGEIIRYPKSGNLSFIVSNAQAGHDLAFLNFKLQDEQLKPGQNIQTEYYVRNYGTNSESGYGIEFKLKNSDGNVVTEKTINGPSINPGQNLAAFSETLSLDALPDGLYTLTANINLLTDISPGNNKEARTVYIGDVPEYSTYTEDVGYMNEGQAATLGNYKVTALTVWNDQVKVKVEKVGGGYSTERIIEHYTFQSFDAGQFYLISLDSDNTEAAFRYGSPTSEVEFTAVYQKVEAGKSALCEITSSFQFKDKSPFVDVYTDMNDQGSVVAGWNYKTYANNTSYDIVNYELSIPQTAQRGKYEFYTILDGYNIGSPGEKDYIQKLTLEVIDPLPDFDFTLSNENLTMGPGSNKNVNLDFVGLNSFNENVTVNIEGLPDEINYSLSENNFSLPKSVQLNFTSSDNIVENKNYLINIIATSITRRYTKKLILGLFNNSDHYVQINNVEYMDHNRRNDSLLVNFEANFTNAATGVTLDWQYSLDGGTSFSPIPETQIASATFQPGNSSLIWSIPSTPRINSSNSIFKMRMKAGSDKLTQLKNQEFNNEDFGAVISDGNFIYALNRNNSQLHKYIFLNNNLVEQSGRKSLSIPTGSGTHFTKHNGKYYLIDQEKHSLYVFDSNWNLEKSTGILPEWKTIFSMEDQLFVYFRSGSTLYEYIEINENLSPTGFRMGYPSTGGAYRRDVYAFFDGLNLYHGADGELYKISPNFDSAERISNVFGEHISIDQDYLYSCVGDNILVYSWKDPFTLFTESPQFIINNTLAPVIGSLPITSVQEDSTLEKAINIADYITSGDTPYDQLDIRITNPNSQNVEISFNSTDSNFIDIKPKAGWTGLSRFSLQVNDGYNNQEAEGIVIVYPNTITAAMAMSTGWNIISMPVEAENMNKGTLFPGAVSSAFSYKNGYQSEDTLRSGVGYWLKFNQATNQNVEGYPRADERIYVVGGWNLIGSLHYPMPTANVYSNPEGMLTSQYYEYNDGYQQASTIETGKGYWIKSSGEGYLYYDATRINKTGTIDLSEEPVITVKDRLRRANQLYLCEDNSKIAMSNLPPVPPEGLYDVRFSDDRYVRGIKDVSTTLNISSAEYPIEITIEGIDVRVRDVMDGSIVNKLLRDGEKLIISNKNINKLQIEPVELPMDYTLYQNYPNPFNPSTIIKYGIPEDAKVRVDIYNALGQRVTTLINTQMEAGYHEIQLNASQLASGVYFYRIQAGKFINTKKMLLIK